MAELFMLFWATGAVFWLVAIAALVMTFLLVFDRTTETTAVFVLTVGITLWLLHYNPLPWMRTHIGTMALWLLSYLALGVGWSFAKWYLLLLDVRDKMREERSRPLDSWPHGRPVYHHTVPTAAKHKGKIIGWMGYWPLSMLGWVVRDPIRRLFNAIYRLVGSTMQRMADHVFKEFKSNDPQ